MYVKARLFVRLAVVSILLGQLFSFGSFVEAAELSCKLEVDKNKVYSTDEVVTLSWETENADSVYINNGIGYVPEKGSISLTGFSYDVTYTLVAKQGDKIKQCRATVYYKGKNTNTAKQSPAPSCSIEAIPETVNSRGSVLLVWDSDNAYKAELVGYGPVHKKGIKVIDNVAKTTVFKLIVEGDGGVSSCETVVYKNDIGEKSPTCQIYTIGPSVLKKGEATTLKWNSKNATSARLYLVYEPEITSEEIGAVSLEGELDIAPSKTAKYILEVSNSEGVGYCEQIVEVQYSYSNAVDLTATNIQDTFVSYTNTQAYQAPYAPIMYGYTYAQPFTTNPNYTVSSVSISQLPYTGVDIWKVLSVYFAIAVVSLISAALVYKKM